MTAFYDPSIHPSTPVYLSVYLCIYLRHPDQGRPGQQQVRLAGLGHLPRARLPATGGPLCSALRYPVMPVIHP